MKDKFMKLWQLNSVLEGKLILPASIAALKADWHYLITLCNEAETRRALGNRDALETELPIDFVQAVLSKVDKYCYLGPDGYLRSWNYNPTGNEALSFLECFNRYGGRVLEDTLDKGTYYINSENGYKP